MNEELHIKVEPAYRACLKEIARQKNTTMKNLICEFIEDSTLKDINGKLTDGESWIHDYKERQRRRLW